MAADKAAPTAAERQDAALRQLLASMRCKQYKKAREACTAAIASGAEPKLMQDYAAVRRGGVRIDAVSMEPPARRRRDPRAATQALDAVIAQRGGGADDVAAEAEDGSGRGRVVEQLAELLLTLNAGTADSVGSSRPERKPPRHRGYAVNTPSKRRRHGDNRSHRSRRRQSVLPFEPFPYPKFDPAALAGNAESSDEDESESGGESASA